MEYSYEELVEMAKKLRAGEAIEIDGVRLKANKVDVKSHSACAYCDVECILTPCYSSLCSLLDLYDHVTRELKEYYYLEFVN